MILSVSRRTDIPAFYSEWFINRIREGFVMVRNPMNYHGVSRISLSPDLVDCIVFWSKNPAPLLPYLDQIAEKYPFYFQFTLNAYGTDIEPNLPAICERFDTFRYISEKYGKESIIWRYDPVMLTEQYSIDWHIRNFTYIADQLKGYTNSCVFSFVDIYDKVKNNLKAENVVQLTQNEINIIAREFSGIAHANAITLKTCAEEVDLDEYGIEHSCCVDPALISKLVRCDISAKKDINQRQICGCVESIDIGQYNTCKHGCKYCYANYSQSSVQKCFAAHIPTSPLLIGGIEPSDKITDRKVKSIKQSQISLFDI